MKLTKMLTLGIMVMASIVAPLNMKAEQVEWETPSGLSSSEFEAYCDTYFNEKVGSELPGTSVAVISKGEIVFEKGYGYADIENGKLSDPDKTIYEYGSVSKLFTWVSLMKLYEEGRLDLNDDIRSYLPSDFKVPTSYDTPITILNLMNHNAGFDDYIIHLFGRRDNLGTLREALEEQKVQQLYEPGFVWSYSNYGAGLAGYIVENIVKEPDYKYIEEEIMRPIGMTNTVIHPEIWDEEDIISNKAKVYEKSEEGFDEADWTLVPIYPTGAANGTTHELAMFAKALLDEKGHPLFKKQGTLEAMLSPSLDRPDGVNIAHGFIEYEGKGKDKIYWHNGETAHSGAFLAVVPKRDFGIVLCTNIENADLLQEFAASVLGSPEVAPHKPEENLPSAYEVEGSYLDLRLVHKGITKPLYLTSYLEATSVKALNENQISVDGSTYEQVAPYIYQELTTRQKAVFTVQDGRVVKLSCKLDYLPVPKSKIILTWIALGILICLIISMIITIITLLIAAIRKRFHKGYMPVVVSILGWLGYIIHIYLVTERIMSWDTLYELQGRLIFGAILGVSLFAVQIVGIFGLSKKNQNTSKGIMKKLLLAHFIISIGALGTLWMLGGFSVTC